MLFNSFEYLIFFPTVVFLYFLLPYRFRWVLLLAASYTFYMWWKVEYAAILVISTFIDYFCSRMMDKYPDKARRKPYLYLSLISNLGILFTFKYFNFFNEAARDLANLMGMEYAVSTFGLLLPMGISFYTFQTMSYSIDVYKGDIKAEKHLGIFALFVTFFPQLVAGPIERAGNLLGQLKEKFDFDYSRVTAGLQLIGWGLFKKVVIADRLALMVNQVYNNPTDYEGLPLILATIFFAFQIYCDFSGYSDIAIGSAQVMGFKLMLNFRQPYFSKSISEFWRRWHISLSTWFKDYVYIPLGGNRVLKWRWYYNVFIVFLVSGLWHGANWTFIIWGALHGVYQVFGSMTNEWRNNFADRIGLKRIPKLYSLLQISSTFVLVCFAWIFFRANSLPDAIYIIEHLFTDLYEGIVSIITNENRGREKYLYLGLDAYTFLLASLTMIFLIFVESIQRKSNMREKISRYPTGIRWVLIYLLIASIIFLGVYRSNEFIYFQF